MKDLRPSILNYLLKRLSSEDSGLLEPLLEFVDLPLRKALEARNRPIENVYFIERGIASVVASGGNGGIEIGLIGREGMTGMAVVMGADRTPYDTFIQSEGDGWQISADDLRTCMAGSPTLRNVLLLFAQAFSVQTSHTAIANGRGKLEERLARWLLMAHDRSDSDLLSLTQEFVAQMLSVRRAGVTVAVNHLAKTGTINITRGVIDIVDREGLIEQANGLYGIPEKEYRRLFS